VRPTLSVALACAAAGIVVGVVTISGLGIVFTQFVVHLSKDMLLPALMLTMLAGMILGMGIPTTPAYIIMTALLVPAIVKLGVIVPAAHMFAFYFAILSASDADCRWSAIDQTGLGKRYCRSRACRYCHRHPGDGAAGRAQAGNRGGIADGNDHT
jgi:hypothetical protein